MTANDYPGQGYATQANGLWQYTSQPLAVNWEYQELPQSANRGWNLQALNEAGAAGWELCHVSHQHYLMKRKLYPASDYANAMTANVSIPWSDAERRQLQQLHSNGMSLAQIGAHLGRSKNSVSRQVALLALRRERISNPPPSPRTHPKGPVGHPKAPRVTLPVLPSLRVDSE